MFDTLNSESTVNLIIVFLKDHAYPVQELYPIDPMPFGEACICLVNPNC